MNRPAVVGLNQQAVANQPRSGIIFGLERFCTHDGPGIRTIVFLKGCPLRCAWCHNPEGMHRRPEILYSQNLCRQCGDCVAACANKAHRLEEFANNAIAHVYQRGSCVSCGACVSQCPAGALELAGRRVTVEEIMREVLEDKVFYGDTGDLTLSGGEPTAQIDFAVELLEQARQAGLHCCVETSGITAWPSFARLLPLVDLFLFDFKESCPQRHHLFTGKSNQGILESLDNLHRHGARVQLQCPIIPGFNDRDDHIRAIAALSHRLPNLAGVKLIPYHPLGKQKAAKLGLPVCESLSDAMSTEYVTCWATLLKELGVPLVT